MCIAAPCPKADRQLACIAISFVPDACLHPFELTQCLVQWHHLQIVQHGPCNATGTTPNTAAWL